MKYMGSKNRIAKHILPIMLEHRKEGQWWVEPFVGGGNMIDKVKGKRAGFDSSKDTIDALKLIRDGLSFIPKDNTEYTEHDYKAKSDLGIMRLDGFASYAYSYGGKHWGGWSRTSADGSTQRDYVAEAYRNAVKQSPLLQYVELINTEYIHVDLSRYGSAIIYCDPPYKGSTGYRNSFDHVRFWDWCHAKSSEGHTVFVSEYTAPEWVECIWEKEIVSSLTKDTGSKKGLEKLFRVH